MLLLRDLLLSGGLLGLGLEELAAEGLLYLLHNLGFVVAEHLEEVVVLALMDALHHGELEFV